MNFSITDYKHIFLRIVCVLIFTTPTFTTAQELKPFTTDGCSVFPDGNIKQHNLWLKCCIQHDLKYWKGGTFSEKLDADNQLEACVRGVGEPEIATIMLAGVRIGGSPYLPTPYRWGYGWPYPRGYKALSQTEKHKVQQSIEEFKNMLETLSSDLN